MVNDINIFYDIISKEHQDILEDYFLDTNLKWREGNNTDYLSVEFPQKVIPSEDRIPDNIRNIILDIETNVLRNLNTSKVENYRYKINLLESKHFSPQRNENDGIHVDRNQPHISIIYYINDSDGDTKFFNYDGKNEDIKENLRLKKYHFFKEIKSVSPEKGKVVVFDGLIPHRSTYPTKGKRCVINFNTVIKTNPSTLF